MLSPAEWDAVRLSLKVAGWAIAVGLPLAVALAWLLARKRFPGRLLLEGLLYAPLVVPPVVVGYLLLVTFGRTGPVGGLLYEWFGISLAFTWRGAAVAAGIMAFPLMLRAVRLAFEAQDLGLEAAARTLGAGPARVFATVTLPLALPGVVAASVLGFARALGEFGAPFTLIFHSQATLTSINVFTFHFKCQRSNLSVLGMKTRPWKFVDLARNAS